MPAFSYFRFLRDAGGDLQTAYERLAWAYDDAVRHVSIGHMRAGLPTDHTPKPRLVPLDVDRSDSPNG